MAKECIILYPVVSTGENATIEVVVDNKTETVDFFSRTLKKRGCIFFSLSKKDWRQLVNYVQKNQIRKNG